MTKIQNFEKQKHFDEIENNEIEKIQLQYALVITN